MTSTFEKRRKVGTSNVTNGTSGSKVSLWGKNQTTSNVTTTSKATTTTKGQSSIFSSTSKAFSFHHRSATSCAQLRALLRKSWIVRRVHFISTFFELLCPVVLMFFVCWLYSTSAKPKNNEETKWNATTDPTIYDDPIQLNQPSGFTVGFAPNNSLSRTIMEEFQNIETVPFKNEEKMEAVFKGNSSGNISYVGIVFENLDKKHLKKGHVKYKIKTLNNATTVKIIQSKFPPKFDQAPVKDKDLLHIHFYKSFSHYQSTINYAYLRLICNANGKKNCQDFIKPFEIYRMPYPRYKTPSVIQGNVFDMLGTCFILFYTVYVSYVVKRITDEKSSKARELLRLIGMSDLMYWFSHFLDNFIVVLYQMIAITVAFYVFPTPVLSLSSYTIVFFVLILFGIQTLLFIMTLATLFNRPVIAIIVTIIIWVIIDIPIFVYLMPIFTQSKIQEVETINFYRHLSCLLPAGSISFFMSQLGQFENYGKGLNFANLGSTTMSYESFPALNTILIMVLSLPIYCFLIWYLDNVWPFQSGVPKSPFYLFMPSYWCRHHQGTIDMKISNPKSGLFQSVPESQTPEICLKNVTKIFNSCFGGKTTVDNLSLNIYSNQITVLLGHNGAGKSTIMDMITGMFSPSSGTVYVNGFNVATQTKSARQSLSLCPQENIMFTELTVEEHLRLFAQLKGTPISQIPGEIDKVLTLLKLTDKKKVYAANLSGGMKRKLSLGIALIGNTNTLILDEPTSGLDPDARRVIWDLLLSIRRERTILITTHYMEEADVLADRIAIMNVGKLGCSGSPFFLKNSLGTGYRLRIDKMKGFESSKFLKLIQKYISTAKLVSEVETEVIYSLETEMSKSDLMKQMMSLFEEIETHKAELKVNASGLSYSSLEDVFLNAGSDMKRDDKENPFQAGKVQLSTSHELTEGPYLIIIQFWALLVKRFHYSRRYICMLTVQLLIPGLIILCSMLIQNSLLSTAQGKYHTTLGYGTKLVYGEGSKTFIYGDDCLVSKYKSIIRNRENGEVFDIDKANMDPGEIANQILAKVGNDLGSYIQNYLYGIGVDKDKYLIWVNFEQYHSLPLALNALFDTILATVLEKDDIPSINVTSDSTLSSEDGKKPFDIIEIFGPWIFTCLLFLPLAFPFLAASYVMFPIEENVSKSKLIQLMTKLNPATYWTANFVFDIVCHLIASLVFFLLLYIFDTHNLIYGRDTHDAPIVLFLIIFVFGISTIPIAYLLSYRFQTPSSGFVTMLMIFLLFGLLANIFLSICDIAKNFMNKHAMFNWLAKILYVVRIVPIFSFLFGFQKVYKLLTLSNFCMALDDDLYSLCSENNSALENGGLVIIKGCCPRPVCEPICYGDFDPFAMDEYGSGPEILYMLIGGLVSFVVVLLWEEFGFNCLYRLNSYCGGVSTKSTNSNESIEDEDVKKERSRIEKESKSRSFKDILTVHGLQKNFGNFTAVQDLTFGVKDGECFGLLGVNGAGKTTTFSMLTGDLVPSSGNAFLSRGLYRLMNDLKKFQSQIGYCPQFDALLPLITGEETLYMFARLRGIPAKNIDRDVRNVIKMVGLEEHADKSAGTYSGGNKRKLSIAIAMIGSPTVLFLDEPSAGVDPAARRKIWQTLGFLKRTFNCSIVLTSHSMEECEALCSRLGIMVSGRFRCLGTPLHLKELYGQGYTVIISLKKNRSTDNEYVDKVKKGVVKCLPSAVLKDYHQSLMQFHITDKKEKWSNIFRQMVTLNQLMDFEDYTVSETTLEQIFLMFSRQQRADAKAIKGS